VIRKIDHIGIAVNSLAEALPFYTQTLGLECTETKLVERDGVTVAIIPIGDTEIELLEPTGPDTPVGKFLAKNGPGIHHIAFETPEVDAELKRLKECGARMIDEVPRPGADGMVGFMHPKSGMGVLYEFTTRYPGTPPSGKR
jgi:methylmalonyl-CoA/ethylmalonyl-CoA epimerase